MIGVQQSEAELMGWKVDVVAGWFEALKDQSMMQKVSPEIMCPSNF
jgi:hypothetical protein